MGLQVAWSYPHDDADDADALDDTHGQHRDEAQLPVPACDELNVLTPSEDGFTLNYNMAIRTLDQRVPELHNVVGIVMRLFAAFEGASHPVQSLEEADTAGNVASEIKNLLHSLVSDDSITTNIYWRLRTDGNYALAVRSLGV